MKHFWDNPEDFTNTFVYCNAWVATAIVGSAVVGGISSAYAANKAAEAQTNAANTASATQLQAARESNALLQGQYDQTRADLSPYRQIGQTAGDQLTSRLQDLTTPIALPQEMLDLQKPLTIDQSTLENLPGYQFARTQGLKAVQNSAAARGLGVSGAALKGAANFSQGLADQNFNNYFNQEQTNRQNAFSRYATTAGLNIQQQGNAFDRLKSLVDTGETAAAQTGVLGTTNVKQQSSNITGAAQGVANNTIGAGNAQAAALNATGSAVAGAANNIGGYYAYRGLYGGDARYNPSDYYGGGSPFTGDAYGGSRQNPLPGLTAADYG